MNITNSYNPEEKRILVFVESNLLVDYFPNFQGLIKKDNNSIGDLKVERFGKDRALISFPLPKEASVMKVSEEKMAVNMPIDIMEKLNNTINRFTNAAIRKKLKTVEFLPLSEYPVEDLKKDVVEAIKNGRNFCLLQSYSEYKTMSEKNKYNFSQIFMYKGTSEYADVALDIWNGDIEGLRERLEGKFERCEWI